MWQHRNRNIKVALLAHVTHIVIDFTLVSTNIGVFQFFLLLLTLHPVVCVRVFFILLLLLVLFSVWLIWMCIFSPFWWWWWWIVIEAILFFIVPSCVIFHVFFSIPIHFTLVKNHWNVSNHTKWSYIFTLFHFSLSIFWLHSYSMNNTSVWQRKQRKLPDWLRGSETSIAMLTIFHVISVEEKIIWFFSYSNHTQSNIINMKRFFVHVFSSLHLFTFQYKKYYFYCIFVFTIYNHSATARQFV